MSKKHLFLALLFVFCMASWAWADGGFYGNVTYSNCSCYSHPTDGDRVYIQSTAGGPQYYFYVYNCSGNPSYSSGPTTFPTGYYNVWAAPHDGSDCNRSYVQTVYHNGSGGDQQVNVRTEKTPPPGE